MLRLTNTQLIELESICPGGVSRDVPLASISNWRIGGSADVVIQPENRYQVQALILWFANHDIRPVVIGMTSNLLFDDAGLRVPCIQIGPRMGKMSIEGVMVKAQAGIWVPGFARNLMQAGLGGVEHICGIPGTLGGLVCMNGGSQRKGIGSTVKSVESVNINGLVKRRSSAECDFTYRHSVYQNNGEIITEVDLLLAPRLQREIRAEMRKILSERRNKFPRRLPNCGSVFKSNPEMYEKIGPPGSVIERYGLKGRRIGGAMISPRHANFIVNEGGASASDVLALIEEVRERIVVETGYELDVEVKYVRATGEIQPAK